MRLKPKTRIQLQQVLAITAFWAFCGILLALYKCVTYQPDTGRFVFLVPFDMTLPRYIWVNTVGPLVGGITGGVILVFYLNERLRRKSYLRYLSVSLLFFAFYIFVLNTGVSFLYLYSEEFSAGTTVNRAIPWNVFFDAYAIRNILTWILIAFLTLQAMRINEKYGPGALVANLLGRHHRPHEVERVFMFIDLSNSTDLAERLGHVGFFNLVSDFIADATDPILNARGEIVEYVGDEIVVAWPLDKAAEDANCINCFFEIAGNIELREFEYIRKYGVMPGFKAAVHQGTVLTGEMGVLKREIVYSGDILNTTARILEQCNVYKERLIMSEETLDLIDRKNLQNFNLSELGELTLRGKSHAVRLFGVHQANVEHTFWEKYWPFTEDA